MKRNYVATHSCCRHPERLLLRLLSPGVFSRNFSSTALQTHADDSAVNASSSNVQLEHGGHSHSGPRAINNRQAMACSIKLQQKSSLKKILGQPSFKRRSNIVAECQPQLAQVRACQDGEQLFSLFEEMHADPQTSLLSYTIYIEFLKRAFQLDQELDRRSPHRCYWNMFEKIKTFLLRSGSEYHPMLIGQVYGHAMASTMDNHHDKRTGSHRVVKLWWSLKDECNDGSNEWATTLPFHPLIVNKVISLCLDAFSHQRCRAVIDEVLENEIPFKHFDATTTNYRVKQLILCNSILNFFGKTGEVDNVEAFYEKMTKTYKIYPDSITFNIRINAHVRNGSGEQFENVFKEYIEQFNGYPSCDAFSALINGYASKGDFAACIDVLQLLLSKHAPSEDAQTAATDAMRHTLPDINLTVFIPIFRTLCRAETPLKAQHGWKFVEYLLRMMESAKLTPNETIYQHLLSLAGTSYFDTPDMDKLMMYYKEMTETRRMKPHHCQLRNALLSGIQYFEFQEQQRQEKLSKEKYEFVQWWKNETVKHGVQINQELHKIIARHFQ